MPSLSFATQAAILQALFQGTPLPTGTLYAALHNANPGGPGTQSTNETSYTNYARVAVPRSPGSWAISQNDPAQVQNIQQVLFPACGATGDTLIFWSIGYAASGPGQLLVSGPIGPGTAYGFTGTALSNLLYVPLLPPGYVVGQAVMLYQFGPAMLLPGGFIVGQVYYLVNVIGNTLVLSATSGGPSISPSTSGSGLLCPVSPLAVAQGVVPTFPPGSMITYMD